MTTNSFVHVEQPTEHPGVARAEAVVSQLRMARGRLNGARGMAALLLAAVVGAILVVVDRMAANLQDGEMLAMWAVISALFFVAVSVGVNALLPLGARLTAAWERAAERRANARADAQFMAYAAFDPRVMHELQAAITRYESANPEAAPAAVAAQRKLAAELPSLYESTRRVRMAYYY
ncbi:hypothetical protein [Variovorax sp. OV329]|uniref:hypothetical protein n=1 Tax=Variovorax sp. OV329 TaxID=1882825 RepID=UPI0008F2B5FF|nr:hypothetical protein [Variovorax sp. OV329]SFM28221.1 hypothetical protein SAMN05444747_10462 [Variovorax sp. OV329]